MVGLAAGVIPAGATPTYYSGASDNTLYNNAVSAASLTTLGPDTFGGSFGSLTAGNTEYQDLITGVNFFDFLGDGTTADTFQIIGTTLKQGAAPRLIEITLPANVFAFGANLAFTGASFAFLCIEAGGSSFNSSCSGNQNPLWSSGTEFVGVTSDTAFNTVWIGPGGTSPIIELTNFETATGTDTASPEVASMAMLGAGLVLLGTLRRRLRHAGSPAQS